nr:rho GTPase-activating protein 31 [Labrus bergylta]
MKNKGNKLKSKKKGSENAFGCDLTEHLQNSGQDVPQVLIKCAEFIEEHGVVDGIYRLSGVTSNIQRLRQEFSSGSEACPDLTKEVYLQDIHCVGSLCKLYFRELPNPLLTYELYSKFTDAASVKGDHERLLHIQRVIKELPTPHFRTLEYLTKHLTHLATLSTQTNMHTRNLALVWAPNLLRSKDIETSSANGDMAFQEVRIQQSVVEFILNHTEQIFSSNSVQIKPKEGLMCGEKYATLPISTQGGPMKLMSLEEAQARSLGPNHPVHRERQRENSLPDTSTAMLYHTVIDMSDSKRKFSGKSKKWKSIFNLGRSVDTKGKLSRNGSVFIRGQGMKEKAALRPSRSMESLCSLPTDDDRAGSNSPAGGAGSNFVPDVKSRTLGSDSLYDLSEHDQTWEFKGNKAGGATGGWTSSMNDKGSQGASAAPQKTLPEQLKVFKGDDLSGYRPTSPKNRRMLYSGSSHNSSSRPSFPGSFFPLESSPRHQRRAINISEPFAVSVPLRVSAVISTNSTPCRGPAKDKASTLKPKESSEQSGSSGKSNTFPQLEAKKQEGTEKKNTEEETSGVTPQDKSKEVVQEGQEGMNISELEPHSLENASQGRETAPSPGAEPQIQPVAGKLDKRYSSGTEPWPDLKKELKIIEPEIDLLDKTFKPVFGFKSTCEGTKLTADVKSKRSRSSPSLSLLFREQSSNTSLSDLAAAGGSNPAKKQPSESDISFSPKTIQLNVCTAHTAQEKPQPKLAPSNKEDTADTKQSQPPLKETSLETFLSPLTIEETSTVEGSSAADKTEKHETSKDKIFSCHGAKKSGIPELEVIQRLSVCLEERRKTLELPILDKDDGSGGHSEELDLEEPWDDLSSTKQWVTSPLHSPDIEKLFNQLSPFSSHLETLSSEEGEISSPSSDGNKQSVIKSSENVSGNPPQTTSSKPETHWMYFPSVPTRVRANSSNESQLHAGKCSSTKQKNTASSQRFYRQMSHEAAASERREDNCFSKHRPYSLNLDLGQRCIRDISNQQNRNSSEFSYGKKGLQTSSGTVNNGLPSELELFLSDRQAPLRRNSAPVSVSSVRTAFMIKTCQAKAVPVVPPKVQYSQIPHSRHESDFHAVKEQEKERPKMNAEKSISLPAPGMSDLREELENKKPLLKHQKHANLGSSTDSVKTPSAADQPVIRRRHAPSLEVFVDCPRPARGNVLQRPSFRNRQRPQSLILFSPPFPIMDYPPSGDDSRLLSSIKSLNDASAENVFTKEMPEGIPLQSKMTIPKSGQRLETSTSCFYQPQRRSMIFDSRSHRQNE